MNRSKRARLQLSRLVLTAAVRRRAEEGKRGGAVSPLLCELFAIFFSFCGSGLSRVVLASSDEQKEYLYCWYLVQFLYITKVNFVLEFFKFLLLPA